MSINLKYFYFFVMTKERMSFTLGYKTTVNPFNFAAIKFCVFKGFIDTKIFTFLMVLVFYNTEQIFSPILISCFYNDREIHKN